jgi:hypothetical protein
MTGANLLDAGVLRELDSEVLECCVAINGCFAG